MGGGRNGDTLERINAKLESVGRTLALVQLMVALNIALTTAALYLIW